MTRMLVLAVLLAGLLGCDGGLPRPTMYAPTDLAGLLPRQIGDVTLEIETTSREDSVIDAYDTYAEQWRWSQRGGAGPSDELVLRFAKASGVDDVNGEPLVVYAVRVDGVPTTDEQALIDSIGLGPATVTESYRIAGQDVTRANHRGGAWSQFYQLGEVLYVIVGSTDMAVTVEDVLAELPTCQRKGKEWLEPCRAPS